MATDEPITVEAVVTAAVSRHGKSIDTSAWRLQAAERCAGSHAAWPELTANLEGASSPWACAQRDMMSTLRHMPPAEREKRAG